MLNNTEDMLYDEAHIEVAAGNGGNGVVSFRHEKFVAFGGPDGGHGGKGGDVYLQASTQVNTLIAFRRKHRFVAKDGTKGAGKDMHGRNGKDLYITVPVGTMVFNDETGDRLADLVNDGQSFLVAKGGRGGLGNAAFASSINQAPRIAERGDPGEQIHLHLELKLLADVGLIGMPNAGKSTLISVISAARPKIADYAFTTLQPNLGLVLLQDSYAFVVADLPGLIEGAHQGAGLGLRFLRHAERTRILVHVLDGTASDPISNYKQVRREMTLFDEKLARKPEIVIINKIDVPEARMAWPELAVWFKDRNIPAFAISAATKEGVPELVNEMRRVLEQLPAELTPELLPEIRPQAVDEKQEPVRISRREDGAWILQAGWLERLARRTMWELPEASARFQRVLDARGITETLEEMGIQLGDIVAVGDSELIWDR